MMIRKRGVTIGIIFLLILHEENTKTVAFNIYSVNVYYNNDKFACFENNDINNKCYGLSSVSVNCNKGEFFHKDKEERQARLDRREKQFIKEQQRRSSTGDRLQKLAVPLFGELDVYLNYVRFSSLHAAFVVAKPVQFRASLPFF